MTPDYDHIAPIREDRTDVEIAEALTLMLKAPVPLADLEHWLDLSDIAERGLDGWEGPLVDVISNEALPQDLRDGVTDLFKHLNKPRSTELHTNEAEYGVRSHQLMAGLVAAGVMTDPQHEEFDALGGGHLYPEGVSEQEVVDVIAVVDAALLAEQAQEALDSDIATAMNIHLNEPLANGTRAEIAAGARAFADAMEAGG